GSSLPYLSGERTPHNDPDARGIFWGMTHASLREEDKANAPVLPCPISPGNEPRITILTPAASSGA
ncbi:hypothetical protein CQA70_29730, partial [Klebsiella pneumoniae]